ncbi:MAG: YgiQ family radical SAM protein, partial [Anaerolineaceae bacterium]|nr:YgiQ family radical SAM protein [Anaerolineaceae bacterium]
DSYIDSPYIGVSVIGRVLSNAGYRVGVIAQPDVHSEKDITRLGEPALFWGVTAGSIDSMVANYTAIGKKRISDDYTPGGINDRRPDRATIVYANLIRRFYKNTKPIVLGGVEASLRRIAHYDYWSNKIRRSILFDAKADILVYGMGERTITELAEMLNTGKDYRHVRGICYISSEKPKGFLELPSFETVSRDKHAFIDMFHTFYQNNDPLNASGLFQEYIGRYLVQNQPNFHLTQKELDVVYDADFQRAQHPYYEKQGAVNALETIKFSVSTHRGCYGECNFCAIAVHEGRTVRWRSHKSVIAEVKKLTEEPDFKGYVLDVGGPTANMYGFECRKKLKSGSCKDRRCLYPEICPQMEIDHSHQISLLKKLRAIKGIKKVWVASGIRYDMVLEDDKYGRPYLQEVVEHHVSGQLKVAPEHSEGGVLRRMGKPGVMSLLRFRKQFYSITNALDKKQFMTYYLIAAHPGCDEVDMQKLKQFTQEKLKVNPRQVQIFTPSPSTYSSLMYYTEMDPFTREPLFVEKTFAGREQQKNIMVPPLQEELKKPKGMRRMFLRRK